MQIARKVTRGQKGAKKLLAQYGSWLVRLRYRYGGQEHKWIKTIELIIEESSSSLSACFSNDRPIGARVAFQETVHGDQPDHVQETILSKRVN